MIRRRKSSTLVGLWILAGAATVLALPQGTPAVPSPASAENGPVIPKYTARHTYELHQAALLHKMIEEAIFLSPEQDAKIDREFAEFIRGTMEDKSRPILIAYAQNKVVLEGEEIEAEGDTADKLLKEKTATGDFQRPLLVDLVRDHLDLSQVFRFQVTVERWNVLRPPPLDGRFQRLTRALFDPQLGLRKEKRDEAFAVITPIMQGVPKPERQPKYADKYEPQAREQVLAQLPPEKAKELQRTLDFLEADYLEWRQPGQVEKTYLDALRTLGQLAPEAKSELPKESAAPASANENQK